MKKIQLQSVLSAMALAASAVLASAPAAAATDLISNGDFESSANFLDGWTYHIGEGTFARVNEQMGDCIGGPTHNCLYVKDGPMSIGQTFSADAGTKLDIQAYYGIQREDPAISFSVIFNSQTLFSASHRTSAWIPLNFSVIATGGPDTLSFEFQNGPIFLDKVSVTAVPEPASVALFSLGLLGLTLLRRGRRAV